MYQLQPDKPFTDEQLWFDHFEGKLIDAWERHSLGQSFVEFCDAAWYSYKGLNLDE